jgi:cob(I)alamin adenosyltransferase
VDELNSALGLALAHGLAPRLAEVLPGIQNELLHLGSDLCFREEDKGRLGLPQIGARHVDALEALIDELNATVGPLENFILPGGTEGSARLHLARTICRRAEREAVALSRVEPIGAFVVRYLNRLSDALFVMARFENRARGVAEPLWNPKL